jgi:hypothetical protein
VSTSFLDKEAKIRFAKTKKLHYDFNMIFDFAIFCIVLLLLSGAKEQEFGAVTVAPPTENERPRPEEPDT